MEKASNEQACREFERIDSQRQEASFDTEPPLTEEQKASVWDDDSWNRKDDAATEHMARIAAEVRYFMGAK